MGIQRHPNTRLLRCHLLVAFLAGCLLAFTVCGLSAVSMAAQGKVHVTWDSGLLTVLAEEAPLGQVLKEIARKVGIEVECLGACSEKVSVSVLDLPLDEAIRELLPSKNYMIVTEENQSGPVRVVIHARGTSGTEDGLQEDNAAVGESAESAATEPGQAKPDEQAAIHARTNAAVSHSGSPMVDEVWDPDAAAKTGEPLPDEIFEENPSGTVNREASSPVDDSQL